MTNTVSTVTQIADHAAAQSDRWLFVALLIIGLFGTFFAMRQLLRERDKIAVMVEDNNSRMVELVEKVSGVVATNTAALTTNTAALTRVSEEIRFCSGRGGNGRGGPVA